MLGVVAQGESLWLSEVKFRDLSRETDKNTAPDRFSDPERVSEK